MQISCGRVIQARFTVASDGCRWRYRVDSKLGEPGLGESLARSLALFFIRLLLTLLSCSEGAPTLTPQLGVCTLPTVPTIACWQLAISCSQAIADTARYPYSLERLPPRRLNLHKVSFFTVSWSILYCLIHSEMYTEIPLHIKHYVSFYNPEQKQSFNKLQKVHDNKRFLLCMTQLQSI